MASKEMTQLAAAQVFFPEAVQLILPVKTEQHPKGDPDIGTQFINAEGRNIGHSLSSGAVEVYFDTAKNLVGSAFGSPREFYGADHKLIGIENEAGQFETAEYVAKTSKQKQAAQERSTAR